MTTKHRLRSCSKACLSLLMMLVVTACQDDTPRTSDVGPEDSKATDLTKDLDSPETNPDATDPLPRALPFVFERGPEGEPVPAEETRAFTLRLAAFLKETRYFDYLLRTSHGVAESTGKKPYALWWTEVDAIKEGALVRFVHQDLAEHDGGGHNMLTGNTRILGPAVAGALMSQDPGVERLVTRLCQGVSSMMLGMVYDADDPLPHIMARSMVSFNHSYTTHDGREKAVDYGHWFYPYVRWNCSRFLYEDNPHWGPVWVTNTRSKDDVGHVYRVAGLLRYAVADSANAELREACGETLELPPAPLPPGVAGEDSRSPHNRMIHAIEKRQQSIHNEFETHWFAVSEPFSISGYNVARASCRASPGNYDSA